MSFRRFALVMAWLAVIGALPVLLVGFYTIYYRSVPIAVIGGLSFGWLGGSAIRLAWEQQR